MAPRADMTDEPNDRLLVRLLHITAVEPLYRLHAEGDHLRLAAAKVHIDPSRWPLGDAERDAVTEWAAAKCGIRQDAVTLQVMPWADAGYE